MRRREFIAGIGVGIGSMLHGRKDAAAASPMTGAVEPKLALYEALMADLMAKRNPPGASLAVSKDGRLIYARGFGLADLERREPVQPRSLFRIASLTKAFTSTAVFQLIQQNKLRSDDKVFEIVKLQPFLERGARLDPRIRTVTVLNCLQHTGGWDRSKGFDPMGWDAAEQIAHTMGVRLPVTSEQIIRYTMGRRLDFDSGTKSAYSNFGYCVLGRVIEAVSGERYADYVKRHVLSPLGITRMRLGRADLSDRAPDEVKYYDGRHETSRAVSGREIGRQMPMPYGVECIESMDANGGWIASAPQLVRFLDAFNDIRQSKLLDEASIRAMLGRPPGALGLDNGKPQMSYYACGWEVRVFSEQRGAFNKSHSGGLRGSNTLMFARQDRINWAILFNGDGDRTGKNFSDDIVAPLNAIATSQIKDWPEGDLYPTVAL